MCVCVCVCVGWLPQCIWIHGVYLQCSREILDLHTGAVSGQGDLNMLLSLSLSLSLSLKSVSISLRAARPLASSLYLSNNMIDMLIHSLTPNNTNMHTCRCMKLGNLWTLASSLIDFLTRWVPTYKHEGRQTNWCLNPPLYDTIPYSPT